MVHSTSPSPEPQGHQAQKCEFLTRGIPTATDAWGLWALLGATTLLLLFSLTAHLYQWARAWRSRHRRQERCGEPAEEAPLYGNLHYLQTGRLCQESGPEQPEPSSGGPERPAQEGTCYTSLQLRPPPRGRTPSPSAPIKYSEVVLDSEPAPAAGSGPELELYASVSAQARRARASFRNEEAYANSQPSPS
ncbi:signaling threshold-regulating transmembrane adapter 1 [Sorex araneus]|uniref:signaling threshold-regulating transmembrane adapter 1 n=1 Tax=Sorex araneus TaxID=42254 RepID=UPI0024340550|nr:signaling threshold-regulating transmembrane adapter 1 [Sorex araneus]